jgi:hypothetical protein
MRYRPDSTSKFTVTVSTHVETRKWAIARDRENIVMIIPDENIARIIRRCREGRLTFQSKRKEKTTIMVSATALADSMRR